MTVTQSGECVRILQCMTCRTVEELPDWTGPVQHDAVLQHIDLKHGGASEQPHHRALHRVDLAHWRDDGIRRQIHERMWSGTTGFVPEVYATRDTLTEEASKCFIKHHRSVPCIDYMDHRKRLGNPAARDRKKLARELRNDNIAAQGPKVYLCSYCPVQTMVDRKKWDAT